MFESVSDCVSELTSASSSNYCLVHWRSHGGLEGFPGGMLGVTELTVVWFKLEELCCSFHAQRLCWFWFIFRWTLNKVCVLLLSLMKDLYHMLSKHGLVRGAEFMSVRCCVFKRFLCHYFTQNG